MSMSHQMTDGDGIELLKRFEKHRPNQIKKKLKFTIFCPGCKTTFKINDDTMWYWEGEVPSENGITIECPKCKHEEDY